MTEDQDVLLVAARPYDLSDASFDGFVTHHARVLDLLQTRYRIRLLLLRPQHDQSQVRANLREAVIDDVALPELATSRSARLRRALGLRRGAPLSLASRQLSDAVRRSGASRAVTLGPWLGSEYEPIYRVLPTMHFYEEDLNAMPENAPQSLQARLLRRLEDGIQRHARSQPKWVVFIGLAEEKPARRRYAKSHLLWHPYLLPQNAWPLASSASHGTHVLVVGQFAQPRNAEGLQQVLDALIRLPVPPKVKLVSAAGTHPCLQPHLDSGALVVEANSGCLYETYRSAAVTIVPARRVSGIKTTVLQAWAAGCPVVCFLVSASSVGPFAASCVLHAPTPEDLAREIVALVDNQERREQLSDLGRRAMERYFDPRLREEELLAAVRSLTSGHAGPR